MEKTIQKSTIALLSLYLPLCYLSLHKEWGLDFSSYYYAAHFLANGLIPYENIPQYIQVGAPANPNPPLTLGLFSLVTHFGYVPAFIFWLIFSTGLGIMGAYKTLQTICPRLCQAKERSLFLLIYFSIYPILANTIMLQLGGCLLFFLAYGYDAFLNKREAWAGFWWGSVIALKLFPGLLFIYVLLKRRFRLAAMMGLWAVVLTVLPVFFVGEKMYESYAQALLHKIFWYGINWNMSVLGFLYRVLVPVVNNPVTKIYDPVGHVLLAKWLHAVMLVGLLGIWVYFFKRLDSEKEAPHRGYATTLILMILLSPFGWLYYAPMLLLPMIVCFYDALLAPSRLWLWFLSFFCICFPLPVTHVLYMESTLAKWGIYSFHFYGLLILAYLTCTYTRSPDSFTLRGLPEGVKQGMIGMIAFSLVVVILRCGLILLRDSLVGSAG